MATHASVHVAHEKVLHFGVWAVQLALAGFFAAMAVLALVLHAERLVELMPWTANLPLSLVRTLAAVQLAGAVVLSAPSVTPAMQRLVGAVSLVFLALSTAAGLIHLARGELRLFALGLVVSALAAFVAWGRLAHRPLETLEAS